MSLKASQKDVSTARVDIRPLLELFIVKIYKLHEIT